MNIVLVIVDTLRYDYIGANGNDWIKTPNMDRLAAESWVFDRSFTASYPTIPHRTDVMTGQYGAPFHAWSPLRFERHTFVRELAEAGYCTQLIHDTPHLVNGGHNFDWPFHAWTPVRGAEVDRPWIDGAAFDDAARWPENWGTDELFDFADHEVVKKNRMVNGYLRANRKRKRPEDWNCAKLFLKASEFLEDNASRDNFFLWIDCFDPHEPWDVPRDLMKMYDDTSGYDGRTDPRRFVARNDERMTEAAKKRVAASYAAKVSWVDRWLGRFLDTLDDTGLSKNTALVFTADHGTKVGEFGHFGKQGPPFEQEARTPFMVRAPGAGSGRSDIVVQPQDIYATVMGIAGVPIPPEVSRTMDSHDVLKIAREGGVKLEDGPRGFALAGGSASSRWSRPGAAFCSLFDGEWWMEVAAKPEDSRIRRYGSEEDEAAANVKIVEELHAKAVNELERRGADPRLMKWLRAGGETDFPDECVFWDGWPGPAGFTQYFARLYGGE